MDQHEGYLKEILQQLKRNNELLYKSSSLRWTFLRGLIIGFASVIGGSLLIALALWFLNELQYIPVIGEIADLILELTKTEDSTNTPN